MESAAGTRGPGAGGLLVEADVLGDDAPEVSYAAKASFVFIPDGDTASLVQILVKSMQQLNTLNEQLGTVRQTYSETKKLVGFAEDAIGAFRGLARADVSGSVQLLEDAVPNLRFFDREAHHINSWTQAGGELNALVRGVWACPDCVDTGVS